MKNVVVVKSGTWGEPPASEQMRVWPLSRWNIRNINIYKKNIYKKQTDKQQNTAAADRNKQEHIGTTFQTLFQKCSAKGICLDNPQSLVDQGLQRVYQKSCSALFRPAIPPHSTSESPIDRGFAVSNF